MLFDPKWEKPTDVFSLESLIAWLEKMPTDQTYRYGCNVRCLLARYFTAMGFKAVKANLTFIRHDGGTFDMPKDFDAIAHATFSRFDPETDFSFGGALKRARLALAHRLSAEGVHESLC